MAVTALNSTTLTNAISASDNVGIVVGSTTNISVGSYLALAGKGGYELVKVQAIPVSGQVNVMRGVGGTRARAQAAGITVWIGNPADFKQVRDNAAAVVGDSSGLPDFCLPGTRARDCAGNEYVMVDLTFTGFVGVGVNISHDGLYTATVLASTTTGSAVGILAEEGTSNQWAWAQVYGFCDVVQLVGGSSLVTSTGIFQPASSVSTPSVGILGRTTSQASTDPATHIFGMFPASAATTATTSASSATGLRCSAFLNYPYTLRQPSS